MDRRGGNLTISYSKAKFVCFYLLLLGTFFFNYFKRSDEKIMNRYITFSSIVNRYKTHNNTRLKVKR